MKRPIGWNGWRDSYISRHLPQLVTASPVWTLPPTTAIVQTKPAALDLMRLIENYISIVMPH
ncbi:hypothetical protein [Nostoc sp. KVJ20]|uniref:hypothetical protein n=1 Tax=Nostoc sp. KVJ20 TaxID=457944 RepID=UPI00114CD382|nr:hypothetical protein [Nostoc sp. KVJ20]